MLTPRTIGSLGLFALVLALALALALALGTGASHGQLISVFGNNRNIEAGDPNPSLANHTDFGSVDVAVGFIDRVFTIRNTGEASLRLVSLQRFGAAAGEFTIPFPPALVIPGGAQTNFTVRFNPALPRTRTAAIRIGSTASNHPTFDFAIEGFGLAPAPDINLRGNGLTINKGDSLPRPADHTDFESVELGGAGVTRTFTIENLGELGLSISAVGFLGNGSSAFSITRFPGSTVPPQHATTFDVTFVPPNTGLHTVTIRITSNDPDEGNYDFVIQGEGTTLASELILLGDGKVIANGDQTPSLEDHTKFENTKVQAGRSTRVFTIKNSGQDELAVASIVTTGGDATDFSVPSIPSAPIPPGGTATFQVHFNPTAPGLRTTTLRLESNDSNNPIYEVALLGPAGKFELLRIVRSGNDAILYFNTNPDTAVTTYIYNVQFSRDLQTWRSQGSFSSPGGTSEEFRHVDGFAEGSGYWRIMEVAIR